VPPVFVVEVTVKLNGVTASVLVNEMVWFGGLLVPTCVVTFTALGLTLSKGAVLTKSVTGMFNGLLPAVGEEMLTVPVQVPIERPVVFTATAIVPCPTAPVVPLVGDADRKFAHA